MSDGSSAAQQALTTHVVDDPGVVVVLGGVDTGKTTLARNLLRSAASAGLRGAFLDTDVGQSTVGPPTTIGLRYVDAPDDLEDPFPMDACYFVGGISPSGRFLPLVSGTAQLVAAARANADLVVVDTSGLIAGMGGQTLKFHKLELARPDRVIGLQRGEELEPVLHNALRFSAARVDRLPVHPEVRPTSAETRADNRAAQLSRYFSPTLSRFRIRSSVFTPSLPPGFDEALLDRLLVGLDDGSGNCLGMGLITHEGDGLRLLTPSTNGAPVPRGLRLGGVRVDAGWQPRSIDLRALLGTA